MVSPYLTKPLRTIEQVARELEEAQRRRLAHKGGRALLEPDLEMPDAGGGSKKPTKVEDPRERKGPRPHID
jgi:hypothetical protein